MEENLITITINNYKGKKFTFTAPADATVDTMKVKTVDIFGKNNRLTNVTIELMCDTGIKEIEEDI